MQWLRGPSHPRASLDSLPTEILFKIFAEFQAEDLCALSCVNSTLHQVSDDDHLWAPLCHSSWRSTEEFR